MTDDELNAIRKRLLNSLPLTALDSIQELLQTLQRVTGGDLSVSLLAIGMFADELAHARKDIPWLLAELEVACRSRDAWEKDAMVFAESRKCQEEMTDRAKAEIDHLRKQLDAAKAFDLRNGGRSKGGVKDGSSSLKPAVRIHGQKPPERPHPDLDEANRTIAELRKQLDIVIGQKNRLASKWYSTREAVEADRKTWEDAK